MERMLELLRQAKRPMAIVGGSRWSAAAVAQFQEFAAAHALPVACSFRRQMLFDHQHPCYAGDLGLSVNPDLLARIRAADLLLLLGGRLSEVPSQGYTLLDIPSPQIPLIHVHPDPNELGRVYQAALPINATPTAFCAALATTAAPVPSPERQQAVQEAHAVYLAWSDPGPVRIPGDLQMGEVMQHLRAVLPQDTIVCNGAGNFATWVHRFWPFRQFGTQLAPTSGSMGYGLPAGVGAQRLWPDRTVLVFTGDGDFLMHGQEFATAVQYRLPLIVVLLDNGMYGTIRMHQERKYPHRVCGTVLQNPDFAAYARAFGGHGERIERTADFAPALERLRAKARATRLPVLLHCLIDPEAITPSRSLSQIRGEWSG
jgi:acetolactate synthase-1/2/3 large subunit